MAWSKRRKRWLTGACAAVAMTLGAAPHADAQRSDGPHEDSDESDALAQTGPSSDSLRGFASLSALAERLDDEPAERQLVTRRLAASDDPRALDTLVAWLESEPELEPAEWLPICEALAPHAERPKVRTWLARILSGAPFMNAQAELESSKLCRGMAAHGLAASQHPEALSVLRTALSQSGALAQLAASALRVHPPTRLDWLLDTTAAPGPELVLALDELGDLRAFERLRDFVRQGTPDVRARAALALFHHGHLEVVAVAKHWTEHAVPRAGLQSAQQPLQHVELLAAAAEILMATRDSAAARAFEHLLSRSPERALELLRRFAEPSCTQVVLTRWATLSPEQQLGAFEALGKVGGKAAIEVLRSALGNPAQAVAAGKALAESRDPEASRALLRALRQPKTQLVALRALLVKRWLLGSAPPELNAQLDALSKHADPEYRSLADWGRALEDPRYASSLSSSDDWHKVAAGSATLLVHSPELAKTCVGRLSTRNSIRNPRIRAALATSLWDPEAGNLLASSQLHWLLDGTAALAPVVARLLAARRETRLPARLQHWLSDTDPELRAAALFGLGSSPDVSATSLLVEAYRGETLRAPRRAALEALAMRPPEPRRAKTLRFARDFDPDPAVRAAARRGLNGSEALPAPARRGRSWVWVELEHAAPSDVVLLQFGPERSLSALLPAGKQLIVLGLPELPTQIGSHAL